VNKETTLVFLRDGDRLLLAMKKRGFGAGRWNGIGGKLDAGETVVQAMIRECQEEIGVTPTQYHKVAEHDFILDSETPTAWHMFVHTYVCNGWEGIPVETEEMAPQWFTLDTIPYDTMWQDDRYWLPQILAGQFLRTIFTFDTNDTLLDQTIIEVPSL
jgi:8-oxo-dGTP diphosphatase/2-hydroxy-dATP diphosphatase